VVIVEFHALFKQSSSTFGLNMRKIFKKKLNIIYYKKIINKEKVNDSFDFKKLLNPYTI
jgi:hypothetical protein